MITTSYTTHIRWEPPNRGGWLAVRKTKATTQSASQRKSNTTQQHLQLSLFAVDPSIAYEQQCQYRTQQQAGSLLPGSPGGPWHGAASTGSN